MLCYEKGENAAKCSRYVTMKKVLAAALGQTLKQEAK
jgi:hypothetical protein